MCYLHVLMHKLNINIYGLTAFFTGFPQPTLRMDYRERGSHARGVYPTQDTSRMGTARVKEEEGADTRVIVR